jgi:isoleucyl-tRNA synthetase
MAAARRVVALGRAARTDAKIRVRQPLARAHLLHPGVEISDELGDEIRAELNVHELEQIDTLSGLMRWTVVPNFKALGPRLGSKVNQIKQSLAAADGTALANALDEHGFIEVDGERLEASDLEVRAERHEAFALAEEDGWAVALDLAIDDDLRAEGRARELVRAVNELRKEAGFHVADRIRLTIERTEASAPVLDAHLDHVARETLATSVVEGSGDTVVDLDGHAVSVAVVKDQ